MVSRLFFQFILQKEYSHARNTPQPHEELSHGRGWTRWVYRDFWQCRDLGYA